MRKPKKMRLGDILEMLEDYEGEAGNALFWIEFYLNEARAAPKDEWVLSEVKTRAGRLANEAAIGGDTQTLRDLADILDGKKPKCGMLFTSAQQNVIIALEDYVWKYEDLPPSHKDLVEYSKQCDCCRPISPSTLSDFSFPLPIGKGKPGRRPEN